MVKMEEQERVKDRARRLAEDRVLDLLIPPTPHRSEGDSETRQKFRRMLRAGKLDERYVEMEVEDQPPMPMVEIFAASGLEEIEQQFREMMATFFPRKQKRRRVKVKEALEIFLKIETEKLIDMEKVTREAIRRTETSGIIFIDEIDAVGRHRGSGMGGGHDEREQTLNQLLVEMDGIEGSEGIIVIAATNRPDVLDKALLRPGRFDRQVTVGLPDVRGREQILKVHMRKIPVGEDVDPSLIARGTPGFSGADLANLVNEAALIAARENSEKVYMRHFEKAKDKILMGVERKTMVMSDEEKKLTAYHEAGHAIVGYLMPEHDPVYKVSIIPRGQALGVTMYLPEEDSWSYSKTKLESQLCSLYGGRIAEEIIFGPEKVTTGASNDIERATKLARNMVTKWGLSERLGPLLYEEEEQNGFLGPAGVSSHISDETRELIDEEVRRIIDRNYGRAKKILEDHLDKLHAMAEALIKYETIDREQIDRIMQGQDPGEPKDWQQPTSPPPRGEAEVAESETPTDESKHTSGESEAGPAAPPGAPKLP